MLDSLLLCSQKQDNKKKSDWGSYFPYYPGFSETFAYNMLRSLGRFENNLIYDPWNGSGTTTYVASTLGIRSRGLDLNPVMVVVAIARLLSPIEADSIEPLAVEIVRQARTRRTHIDDDDPLLQWFVKDSAKAIRAMERSVRRQLVGRMTLTPAAPRIDRISAIGAAFYVALFSITRELAATFRSSNPTWFRLPNDAAKIAVSGEVIAENLLTKLRGMAAALAARRNLLQVDQSPSEITIGDTTQATIPNGSVDLILTSPPYCTRIDYAAATRIELAVLSPLIRPMSDDLGQKMIGSVRVPNREIEISSLWGDKCYEFLRRLHDHPSKASSGYYYRTHLDYFDKISQSLKNIVASLKRAGVGVFVIQDSFYKEIHNDLPSIITEMAELQGLELGRWENFILRQSMARINPHTRTYRSQISPIESVLCFSKSAD